MMGEHVTILFGLTGGLALFLYGMNSMSDALQKAAGEGMKKILSFLTKNAVMGALAGMLVTAVLQSSSATTVMVIGFVSAGLMSLPQAISVIFGLELRNSPFIRWGTAIPTKEIGPANAVTQAESRLESRISPARKRRILTPMLLA